MPLPAGLLALVGSLFEPVVALIDDLTLSSEEKANLRLAVVQSQLASAQAHLEYEARVLEAQASVVKAEAQGASWLQRSWRPITMLSFLALVALDSFGVLANRPSPEAWTLLQLGLGGYVVGRSVEKVVGPIAAALDPARKVK